MRARRIVALSAGLAAVTATAMAQEWWSAPVDLGGASLNSGPAAVTGGHNPIDVFYRGPNDHLWTSWWDGGAWWSAPADLGGVNLTSEPSAVAGGAHALDVFYRGPNNHLWMSSWPDKPGSPWWSGAADLGGVALTSAPAAVTGGQHKMDVFYRGPNNHLWMSFWPDKPGSPWWSAPADLGGVALSSAPAAVANGQHTLDVFYVGPNGHLWMSFWPDKPGSQWWSAATDLGGGAVTSAPVAVANAQHKIDVFYRGPNNHLWTSFWPDKPGSPWWSGAADLGGVGLTSGPGAVAAARDKIDVFYRGPNNDLWTSWFPDQPWLDAQTARPSPKPAPYDLVTKQFDPDNGIPLNPMLGSQTYPIPQLAKPSLCGGGDPWKQPCTTQATYIDNNRGKCPSGSLGGHANWGLALYEGRIRWHGHSFYLQDDDYNINLFRDDLAGVAQIDFDQGTMLHSEFNSDQTINRSHTWFWDQLHQAVDDDSPYHGECNGCPRRPYPKTHALVDDKEAIIMGLYGLDCAHECGAELHPVFALAIHVKEDLNDDTWAIFVRNWGDEGYCSSGQERIAPDQPFTFSFRFKKAGATQVSMIPAPPNDPAGEHGTVFFADSDNGGVGFAVSGPALVPNEAAVVTFRLPPSSQGGFLNGMLHMKWSVAARVLSAVPFRGKPMTSLSAMRSAPPVGKKIDAEGADTPMGRSFAKMTPTRRNAIEKALPIPPRRPSGFKLELKPAEPRAPVRPGPPVVKLVPDLARDKKEQEISTTARRILLPR